LFSADSWRYLYQEFIGGWVISETSDWIFVLVLFLSIPFLIALLTARFRSLVEGAFSFNKGFYFAFLTYLYACVWQALAVFIYLAYIDNGFVFDSFQASLERPEVKEELERSGIMPQIMEITNGGGIESLVDGLRMITPATYTAVIIYFNFIIAPVLSAFVALTLKRRKREVR
jgi:hypothetical protein